jgi:hypothetical protein
MAQRHDTYPGYFVHRDTSSIQHRQLHHCRVRSKKIKEGWFRVGCEIVMGESRYKYLQVRQLRWNLKNRKTAYQVCRIRKLIFLLSEKEGLINCFAARPASSRDGSGPTDWSMQRTSNDEALRDQCSAFTSTPHAPKSPYRQLFARSLLKEHNFRIATTKARRSSHCPSSSVSGLPFKVFTHNDNLQPAAAWISSLLHFCATHPLVLAATSNFTIRHVEVSRIFQQVKHPSWVHTCTCRCPNQHSSHGFKTSVAEYSTYPTYLSFIWGVRTRTLAGVENLSFNIPHFPHLLHRKCHATHLRASCEIRMEIPNLYLPLAHCKLQMIAGRWRNFTPLTSHNYPKSVPA